ncbi:hypothetical protein SDC9_88561 [bioreactor metagenome]|uniref:Uncharacterized protein n=1 Tax=bioreactor metagenome TaxID=1076179 RepID=A0A644ZPV2_9ZZZZ
MGTQLMAAPRCPVHDTPMVFHPAKTPVQEYCGAWYYCHESGCACSTLIPSPEVQKIMEGSKK